MKWSDWREDICQQDDFADVEPAPGHAILSEPSEAKILAAHRERRLEEVRAKSLPGLIYIPPSDELNDFFGAARQPGENRWQCATCRRTLVFSGPGQPLACSFCIVGM